MCNFSLLDFARKCCSVVAASEDSVHRVQCQAAHERGPGVLRAGAADPQVPRVGAAACEADVALKQAPLRHPVMQPSASNTD